MRATFFSPLSCEGMKKAAPTLRSLNLIGHYCSIEYRGILGIICIHSVNSSKISNPKELIKIKGICGTCCVVLLSKWHLQMLHRTPGRHLSLVEELKDPGAHLVGLDHLCLCPLDSKRWAESQGWPEHAPPFNLVTKSIRFCLLDTINYQCEIMLNLPFRQIDDFCKNIGKN